MNKYFSIKLFVLISFISIQYSSLYAQTDYHMDLTIFIREELKMYHLKDFSLLLESDSLKYEAHSIEELRNRPLFPLGAEVKVKLIFKKYKFEHQAKGVLINIPATSWYFDKIDNKEDYPDAKYVCGWAMSFLEPEKYGRTGISIMYPVY